MNRVSLALAILAAITVSGCAGSGGPSVAPPSSYVLNPNVVELDKTTATVDSVTTDTVVLKNAPSLSKDQIIIHNALDDKRFLRKVVSASTSGSTTTVKTADAGVEDVFKSAAISQQAPISATDLLKLKPAQAGITFTPATGGRGRAPSSNGVAINFSNLLLKADNGTPIVQLDGTLNLSAGIETKLDKSGLSVDQFLIAPYLDANGTLTARGRTAGSFVKEFPISLNLQIPVTPLGPLGVNCGVQLMMRVEGSYSAEGQFTVKASVHAKEGLQYTKAQGWSLIHEFDKSFDLTPPAFRGALEMGVSLVRPKIGVDILGIGEAHVTADAVKVVARLTAQTTPVAGFFVEAQGDFGFTLGGSVRLGPITLWNESRDFKLARFDIIKPFLLGNYGAGDTMIVYADLALRNLRAMNGDGTGDHVVATSTSAIYAPNVCNANGRICFGKFNAQGKGELWMATNTGGGAQRLTNGALSINHPVWNPTGTEIAFDATDTKQVKQIYVYNLAQNNIRQLTKDATASRIPTWSADGRWIYFEAATTFGTKVVAKTSASTSTYDVILANDTTTYGEPSLSPDGFHLLALRGGSEIVISDEQGRNERVILADPHLSRPTFSPDGLRVLLQYNDVGTAQVRSYDLSGRDEKIYATGMQPSWGLKHRIDARAGPSGTSRPHTGALAFKGYPFGMPQTAVDLDLLCVNTIRGLAIDAVQKANSGHPGMPMGAAPMAHALWTRHLRHNPKNPQWFNRDRFILSAGHGSMLLYSLLHLTGYDLSLDDIKNFRQFGSKTPGHPENTLTPGVEMATGPLGQGISTAVGMAIAESHLAAVFNRPGFDLVEHYTYGICSDGDLMEGVAQEACSLAGHLKLGKLIFLYDDNNITIDGPTELAYTEDATGKFEAMGWQVLSCDGMDIDAVDRCIEEAKKETDKPTLIRCKTVIGFGSPNRAGKSKAHGEPLGADEAKLTKEALGLPVDQQFFIPDDVLVEYRQAVVRGEDLESEWAQLFDRYAESYPDDADRFAKALACDYADAVDAIPAIDEKIATRAASGKVVAAVSPHMTGFIGGAADLTGNVNVGQPEFPVYSPSDRTGRTVHYGVREHAMMAAVNGITLHGASRGFGGTFLIFSDYCKPSIRLAALMEIPSVFVFTHDSIGLGEDGPTHQPIEQIAGLRAIPNLNVFRPADGNEAAAGWNLALSLSHTPTALILSRQALPNVSPSYTEDHPALNGGYVLAKESGKLQLVLIATGSEVSVALGAKEILEKDGIGTRVVSLPSWFVFEEQSDEYQLSVLPEDVPIVSIEAASTFGWAIYSTHSLGIDHFGASAPGDVNMREFGFTPENIAAVVRDVLEE